MYKRHQRLAQRRRPTINFDSSVTTKSHNMDCVTDGVTVDCTGGNKSYANFPIQAAQKAWTRTPRRRRLEEVAVTTTQDLARALKQLVAAGLAIAGIGSRPELGHSDARSAPQRAIGYWRRCLLFAVVGVAVLAGSATAASAAPVKIDGTFYNHLYGVACPSASQCTAVDSDGYEVMFNPTSPGSPTPTPIDPTGLNAMACPSTSQCTAVDGTGYEVTFSAAGASYTLRPGTKITKSKLKQKQHQAEFGFKAIGTATGFQCALVKEKPHHNKPKPHFARCRSPKTYKQLKPGKYTFEAHAFNAAGADQTPATKSFTIH